MFQSFAGWSTYSSLFYDLLITTNHESYTYIIYLMNLCVIYVINSNVGGVRGEYTLILKFTLL